MKSMTYTASHKSLPTLAEMIGALPLTRWIQVMRERRRLAALDPHMLADIGVDTDAQNREAARPFWDVTSRR
ncbi:MAG: DUF1127 domain-containing protein [Pseudomonadota bacterium]